MTGTTTITSAGQIRARAWAALVGAATVGVAILASGAMAQSFEVLPSTISGANFGAAQAAARGVSGNGLVVFGSTSDNAQFERERAVVWRKVSGVWRSSFLPMEGPGDAGYGRPMAASFDGDVIVGMSDRTSVTGTTSYGVPAVWRGVNSATTLELPFGDGASGLRGVITGVSRDGTRAHASVRSTTTLAPATAWLVRQGAAPEQISPLGATDSYLAPNYPAANTMSGDGTRLVSGRSGGGVERAEQWDSATGWTTLAQSSASRYPAPFAMSGDGRVVGGTCRTQAGLANQVGLPLLLRDGVAPPANQLTGPGFSSGVVLGLNYDGNIGVGAAGGNLDLINNFFPPSSATCSAYLWFANGQHGTLASYLTGLGVSLEGVTPRYATGVSDDGLTIVGVGTRAIAPNGIELVSFVATIPTPGAVAMALPAVALVARRRRV
jgi:hypothetical protein